nr:glycoside hydrolase family 3 C-terminal domain-containing protein [Clostridia bacterium]
DLNCGNLYGHIMEAFNEGALNEDDLRTAATNLMTIQMRLGFFDKNVPFDNIPYDEVDSPEHRAFNYEVSAKSLVLLKNRNRTLPLSVRKTRTIAVIGPNADSQGALKGNYHGTAGRWHTILEGVAEAFPKARVLYSEGCHIYKDKVQPLGQIRDRDAEVVQLIGMADAVVLAVGLDEFLEGEEGDAGNAYASGDKKDLLLPSPQRHLISIACDKANELGKPVIIVNVAGSSIDLLDGNDKADAIVQAFYPGAEGGRAIGDLLRGDFSPSGRLPVTFYSNTNTIPDFTDYSMENRTYRFLHEKPLYPFGYGLSYTTFEYDTPKTTSRKVGIGQGLGVKVKVTNTGKKTGDEIVQVYVRITDAPVRVPNFQLCGFKRVTLEPGETKQVECPIDPASLQIVLEDGRRVGHAGRFELFVGGSQPDALSTELTGKAVRKVEFQVQ